MTDDDKDKAMFSHAFNCGMLAAVQVLKGLDGPTLKAAIEAIENTAGERVEEVGVVPWEDTLMQLEPFIIGVRELINGK